MRVGHSSRLAGERKGRILALPGDSSARHLGSASARAEPRPAPLRSASREGRSYDDILTDSGRRKDRFLQPDHDRPRASPGHHRRPSQSPGAAGCNHAGARVGLGQGDLLSQRRHDRGPAARPPQERQPRPRRAGVLRLHPPPHDQALERQRLADAPADHPPLAPQTGQRHGYPPGNHTVTRTEGREPPPGEEENVYVDTLAYTHPHTQEDSSETPGETEPGSAMVTPR